MLTEEKFGVTFSKYLRFRFLGVSSSGKTNVWLVDSLKSDFLLGEIKWYSSWRQYCFFPTPDSLFNSGCLKDIQGFIKRKMDERKG
jgi:hypothetical protein